LPVSRATEMAYHARRELRVRKEKMERTQDKIVVSTFGPRAKAYVDSAVHAKGLDLDTLEALIGGAKPARAIDIGCGGGHVSYLMARHAGTVVAADLSSEMLAAVAASAKERGLANIETARASAEKLPFPDASFDFAATRYSAHHWHDFQGGLREARRVLKPGSRAAFIDAYSAGSALVDTHLQAVELTRDPSHVRDYSIAEWTAALALAGFRIDELRTFRVRMDFPVWVARIATPEENVKALRKMQMEAPEEVKRHTELEPDGSFMLDVMMIQATAG
jgi:ubiquinone/menaquinone biosynthesis C-methylase UbiE